MKMTILSFATMASVACLVQGGGFWYSLQDDCSGHCREVFDHCAEHCLSRNGCPPAFPPFLPDCGDFCREQLHECRDCLDSSQCKCPDITRPEHYCWETGWYTDSEECCEKEESGGCAAFYCHERGQQWECLRKCGDNGSPGEDSCGKECFCPNIKEDKCPTTGLTIKNKECCDHKESFGCSEFYCPKEGEPFECTERCDCLCPNHKLDEPCSYKGAYVENKICCEMPDSDGCAAWHCPGDGQPWQCKDGC